MAKSKLWWAYKHLDGTVRVQRFLRHGEDKQDAESDPYVEDMWGPFDAPSYDEAVAEAEQVLGGDCR